ncbi:MAG TPA: tRNA uridine-5-carboxymethylaminomethyl(34) synthesis GTPase MnmE [bacterium]|nr:tRNA uridine-5-carboxymethylaminomethyl(34) synthesis GTPase MnmE [bacterium]
MNPLPLHDTVIALGTPWGVSGLGVIRLSGRDAVGIARKIFRNPGGRKIAARGWQMIYGFIEAEGEILDETLLLVMPAPHSYTREDVVEIQAHGGPVVLKRILKLCLSLGARLADPGEFTRRAVLNGRIDLIQAEAAADLIHAQSEEAARLAVMRIRGDLSAELKRLREGILELAAQLEAQIDFPEEDIRRSSWKNITKRVRVLKEGIESLLAGFERSRLYAEGVSCVIVGRPNAGKSSLLNALLGEERAIVTEIPGTTRDVVEGRIVLEGMPFLFSDTAGLRKKIPGKIERLGIRKTLEKMKESDLILFVVDGNAGVSEDDRRMMEELFGRKWLLVVNKRDLGQKRLPCDIGKMSLGMYSLSCKSRQGLEALIDGMAALYREQGIPAAGIAVTSLWQKERLEKTLSYLGSVMEAVRKRVSAEFFLPDLREALKELGVLTGEEAGEELYDMIFSRFCVGK